MSAIGAHRVPIADVTVVHGFCEDCRRYATLCERPGSEMEYGEVTTGYRREWTCPDCERFYRAAAAATGARP